MKKTVFTLMTLIFLCSISGTPYASAAGDPLEAEKKAADATGAVSGSAAEIAPDQPELLNDWETNGYPDDVGGVYYDDATGNLVIMLVNADEARVQELRSMAQGARIGFGMSRYSYNELLAVQKKIAAEADGGKQKIYGVGVGWTVLDGEVTGFGESGKEFRVVVTVDESVLDEYVNAYESLYGDMVRVKPGEIPVIRDGALVSKSLDTRLLPIVFAAGLLAAFTVLFLNRHRLAYTAQSTTGTTVPIPRRPSRQEVIQAVKEAAVSPPDSVREALRKRLDPL